MMPGLDGFETCRRLKGLLETRHVPVVFMTGLTDTDHVVRGFQAGGVDYVTKPIRPPEVLARIESHLRNFRQMAETLRAADAAGDAILSVDAGQRIHWATPLARSRLQPLLDTDGQLPVTLRRWLAADPAQAEAGFTLVSDGQRLVFSRLGAAAGGGMRILVQRHAAVPDAAVLARTLQLTGREAEVLYWVTLGKTNHEVAAILDMSPRTVNKHLEHIFAKLNVETRTAAAAVALNKARNGVDSAAA
jgi:DNA-binding NarL/FixJ family response regulator